MHLFEYMAYPGTGAAASAMSGGTVRGERTHSRLLPWFTLAAGYP